MPIWDHYGRARSAHRSDRRLPRGKALKVSPGHADVQSVSQLVFTFAADGTLPGSGNVVADASFPADGSVLPTSISHSSLASRPVSSRLRSVSRRQFLQLTRRRRCRQRLLRLSDGMLGIEVGSSGRRPASRTGSLPVGATLDGRWRLRLSIQVYRPATTRVTRRRGLEVLSISTWSRRSPYWRTHIPT